jgi:hypothetical protein
MTAAKAGLENLDAFISSSSATLRNSGFLIWLTVRSPYASPASIIHNVGWGSVKINSLCGVGGHTSKVISTSAGNE